MLHVTSCTYHRRGYDAQTDCFSALPLSALPASVDSAHCYPARALSSLQKSLLGHAQNAACIYALIDPRRGRIRYIGQTKTIPQRYYTHMTPGYGSTKMIRWVAELREAGVRPQMMILEVVAGDLVSHAEYRWIRQYRAHLLNTMRVKRRKWRPCYSNQSNHATSCI